MKNIILVLSLLIVSLSCNKNIYGTYNTHYSKDKSSFFQIKLNSDNTVEKVEIHTINISAKGRWIKDNNKIICYLDSSNTGFPPDTITFKLKGNRLYFMKKKVVKNVYLKKQNPKK